MDTKALRQKVLDLAIRGKLVPQDPNDEPASVLLERIRQQKQQMVKDGKLKAKDIKNDTIIFVGEDNLHYEKFADDSVKCIEDEIPFNLPDGWAWVRLLSIIEEKPTNGYSPKGVEYITNVRNLTLTATTSGFFKPNEFKYVDVKIAPDSKYWLRHNDILIQRSNSRELVGTSCIYDDKDAAFIYPDLMMRIHLMSSVDVRYVDSVLKSTLTREYYIANATGSAGSMPKINQAIVANTLVPLPPCAEQKRLVQYLDEVMNITSCIETGKLDILELVSQAKSKILDLAIRGQLLPQDPTDEPASVLLERIRAEKEELIKQGKIKRDKKESIIFRGEDNSYYEKIRDDVRCIDEEIPFDIPDTWEWVRLENCCSKEIRRGKSPKYTERSGILVFAQKCNTKYNGIDVGLALNLDESTLSRYPADEYMQNGDVVVNSTGTGTLGRVGFYRMADNCLGLPIVPDSHVTVVRGFSSIQAFYLYAFMKASQSELEKKGEGSTNQKELKPLTLKEMLVPMPPVSEQKRIEAAIAKAFSLIAMIEKSLS